MSAYGLTPKQDSVQRLRDEWTATFIGTQERIGALLKNDPACAYPRARQMAKIDLSYLVRQGDRDWFMRRMSDETLQAIADGNFGSLRSEISCVLWAGRESYATLP